MLSVCLCAIIGDKIYITAVICPGRVEKALGPVSGKGVLIMKKTKKLAALLLAALMTVGMAGCVSSSSTTDTSDSSQSTGDSQGSSTVVMATNAEFEPFEYMDGTEYKGIDIEISQKIAEKMGAELEIHNVAFESVIAELTSGKADFAAAGLTINEDRLKNVDFSDTYYSTTQVILVRSDETEITSSADLKGKTVGVQTGTTGDTYATDEDKEYNHGIAEVKRYNKFMDATSDLIAGRLDAVIVDDFPADKLIERNPDKIKKLDEELTGEDYAIAVPKGDTEMLNTVNEVLDELEESGELDEIFDKYLQ